LASASQRAYRACDRRQAYHQRPSGLLGSCRESPSARARNPAPDRHGLNEAVSSRLGFLPLDLRGRDSGLALLIEAWLWLTRRADAACDRPRLGASRRTACRPADQDLVSYVVCRSPRSAAACCSAGRSPRPDVAVVTIHSSPLHRLLPLGCRARGRAGSFVGALVALSSGRCWAT